MPLITRTYEDKGVYILRVSYKEDKAFVKPPLTDDQKKKKYKRVIHMSEPGDYERMVQMIRGQN